MSIFTKRCMRPVAHSETMDQALEGMQSMGRSGMEALSTVGGALVTHPAVTPVRFATVPLDCHFDSGVSSQC